MNELMDTLGNFELNYWVGNQLRVTDNGKLSLVCWTLLCSTGLWSVLHVLIRLNSNEASRSETTSVPLTLKGTNVSSSLQNNLRTCCSFLTLRWKPADLNHYGNGKQGVMGRDFITAAVQWSRKTGLLLHTKVYINTQFSEKTHSPYVPFLCVFLPLLLEVCAICLGCRVRRLK